MNKVILKYCDHPSAEAYSIYAKWFRHNKKRDIIMENPF